MLMHAAKQCQINFTKTSCNPLCQHLRKLHIYQLKTLTLPQHRQRSGSWINIWKELFFEEDVVTVKEGSRPTDDDFKLYYSNISQQGTNPSVLLLITEHSNNYIPKIHQPEFP